MITHTLNTLLLLTWDILLVMELFLPAAAASSILIDVKHFKVGKQLIRSKFWNRQGNLIKLTSWKAWAIPAAKTPTPRKMRRAAPRPTVGSTPRENFLPSATARRLDSKTRSAQAWAGLLAPENVNSLF